MQFDRRARFVLDDQASAGLANFSARKSIRTERRGGDRKQMNSVAVRERGTEKLSRTVRFYIHGHSL